MADEDELFWRYWEAIQNGMISNSPHSMMRFFHENFEIRKGTHKCVCTYDCSCGFPGWRLCENYSSQYIAFIDTFGLECNIEACQRNRPPDAVRCCEWDDPPPPPLEDPGIRQCLGPVEWGLGLFVGAMRAIGLLGDAGEYAGEGVIIELPKLHPGAEVIRPAG